ncbi:hypothetical protein [Neolewinella antarctica]|uniref:YD repeat-containing protein n=1 Tax=Neolewinella antarctica TaxID=442734 RepID=A0ABX0XG43_9BACT|nr:hypothetical protein [Neolewinella antarctica]NJC28275.1 YD repeat-containing protein [Neolewinella antarctica]
MKFSIEQRICSELLSNYYQRLEDVQKLHSEQYRQIEYFTKSNISKEWLSGRITYSDNGELQKEERFNEAGKLIDVYEYQFLEGSIIAISNEEKSTWYFNEHNILVEEMHEYDFDGPDIYKFNFDVENRLVDINNEIRLVWKEEKLVAIVDPKSSDFLMRVMRKTEFESVIFNSGTNESTTYKYNEYGKLIETETGERKTTFKYFGYDMMQGCEARTTVQNKVTYKSYSEEKLLNGKIVERITNYYNNGKELSRTVRERKTMK